MRKYAVGLMVLMLALQFAASAAIGEEMGTAKEKPWIMGRIKGNIQGRVITIICVNLTTNERMETSLNRFGWYAFSDMGQRSPENHKLIIYAGETEVKQVRLKGVKSGGKVPDIII